MLRLLPGRRRAPERPRRWRRGRGGRRRSFVVVLLTPFVVFADAVASRRLLALGDGWTYYFPLHVLAGRMWGDGQIPAWLPTQFSGAPLLAVGQASVFHPATWLFAVLPATLANNLFVISAFVIAGAGAYLLTRHLTGDHMAALVAGLCFGASGFLFAHVVHQAIIATAAWLPWLFYGVELLRERVTPWRVAVAGGSVGAMALSGHFQMLAIALFGVGVYGLTLVLAPDRRHASRRRTVMAVGVATGVGLALGAIQLLPTASVLDATDRDELSYAAASEFAFPVDHLPLLVFPFLFGNEADIGPFSDDYAGEWNLDEMAGYVGAAAAVLAAIGLLRIGADRRVLALVVAGGLSVLAAVAASTPFGDAVYLTPVFGQFRAWARYLVVLDLVVAVLAGYGVAALRRAVGEGRRLWPSRLVAALAVAGLAVGSVAARDGLSELIPDDSASGWAVGLPLAAAAAVLLAVVAFRRFPRAAATVCCLVVAADMVVGYGVYNDRGGAMSPDLVAPTLDPDEPAGWGAVLDAPGGIDRYMLGSGDVGLNGFVPTTGAKGYRSASGFDPLAPGDYTSAVADMQYFGGVARPEDLWRPGSHLLDLLRVTTLLVRTNPGAAQPGPDAALPRPRAVAGEGVDRYELGPRLDDAWVVGATERRSRLDVVAAIAGRGEPFDPARTALVERGCDACPRLDEPGVAGTAERRSDGNDITVTVEAERDGLLVVSEAWFPGWTATIDGEAADVVRADGLLIATPVGAGRHTVAFTYQAPGLRTGSALTALTLVLLVGWGAVTQLRRLRPRLGSRQLPRGRADRRSRGPSGPAAKPPRADNCGERAPASARS